MTRMLSPSREIKRDWRRERRQDQRKDIPSMVSAQYSLAGRKRLSINLALKILGIDWPQLYLKSRVRQCPYGILWNGGSQSFWARNESRLYELAHEARIAYYRMARQIRTDLEENHEEATLLNDAWMFVRKAFKKRGIEIR